MGTIDQHVERVSPLSRHEEALERERHVDRDLLVWLEAGQSLGRNLKVGLDLRDHLAIFASEDYLDFVWPTNLSPVKHDSHRESSPKWARELQTVDAGDAAAQDVKQVLADGDRVAEKGRVDSHEKMLGRGGEARDRHLGCSDGLRCRAPDNGFPSVDANREGT